MGYNDIAFDFDGVINSYMSGWKGATVLPDPPIQGIKEAIEKLVAHGYHPVVYSTRCSTPEGKDAVEAYLHKYDIPFERTCFVKPPALIYVDDRGLRFDGHPETLFGQIMYYLNRQEPCSRCSEIREARSPLSPAEMQRYRGNTFCTDCGRFLLTDYFSLDPSGDGQDESNIL